MNRERLLHEAYNLEKQRLQTGKPGFFNYITNVLNKIGMPNAWMGRIEKKQPFRKAVLTKVQ